MLVFFFSSRRRHTRLQGDWSSDVCSSDLQTNPRRAWASGCFGLVCAMCLARAAIRRSEERRVGKEGRSRWTPYHLKKKKKTPGMYDIISLVTYPAKTPLVSVHDITKYYTI